MQQINTIKSCDAHNKLDIYSMTADTGVTKCLFRGNTRIQNCDKTDGFVTDE